MVHHMVHSVNLAKMPFKKSVLKKVLRKKQKKPLSSEANLIKYKYVLHGAYIFIQFRNFKIVFILNVSICKKIF